MCVYRRNFSPPRESKTDSAVASFNGSPETMLLSRVSVPAEVIRSGSQL